MCNTFYMWPPKTDWKLYDFIFTVNINGACSIIGDIQSRSMSMYTCCVILLEFELELTSLLVSVDLDRVISLVGLESSISRDICIRQFHTVQILIIVRFNVNTKIIWIFLVSMTTLFQVCFAHDLHFLIYRIYFIVLYVIKNLWKMLLYENIQLCTIYKYSAYCMIHIKFVDLSCSFRLFYGCWSFYLVLIIIKFMCRYYVNLAVLIEDEYCTSKNVIGWKC